MKGTGRSSNPFLSGTRPRRFFSDLISLRNKEIMTGNGAKTYNPEWNTNKKASCQV